MYYISKKTAIVSILYLLFFGAIIVALLFYEPKKNTELSPAVNSDKKALSLLTSTVNDLSIAFEKGITQGFDSEKTNLVINSAIAKSTLFLFNQKTENCVAWFAELSEYSNGDMNDNNKNKIIYKKLKSASETLMNGLTQENEEKVFSELESLFRKDYSKEEQETRLKTIQNEYSILKNNVIFNRNDISSYAKNILKLPNIPDIFSDLFLPIDSVSYKIKNSYAQIFSSGNTLGRMADTESLFSEATKNSNYLSEAKSQISIHAPYAEQLSPLCSYRSDSIYYILFCPEISIKKKTAFNASEAILVGLSNKDLSLKLFDATKYLKNHTKDSINNSILDKENIDQDTKIILKGSNIYFAKEVDTEQSGILYIIKDSNTNNSTVLNEREYILFLTKT